MDTQPSLIYRAEPAHWAYGIVPNLLVILLAMIIPIIVALSLSQSVDLPLWARALFLVLGMSGPFVVRALFRIAKVRDEVEVRGETVRVNDADYPLAEVEWGDYQMLTHHGIHYKITAIRHRGRIVGRIVHNHGFFGMPGAKETNPFVLDELKQQGRRFHYNVVWKWA